MTSVSIGGKLYELPILPIGRLKQIAPLAQAFAKRFSDHKPGVDWGEDVEMMMGGIPIIAVWLQRDHPDLTVEYIADHMSVPETKALDNIVVTALRESGLLPPEGEPLGVPAAPAASPPSPSSTNSTKSSRSLSRRAAKAARGKPSNGTGPSHATA